MNSIKSDFCAPCFSGDCGLCRNCCARAMDYIKPSGTPESIQRAHSLKKFMVVYLEQFFLLSEII